MNSYLDDPREFTTRPEYPTTIEGSQKMPMEWAKILDLDELPVEEYMKPMTVIAQVSGSTPPTPPSGETGTTQHNVIFIADGAELGTYKVNDGEKATVIPIVPDKPGYTFSAWNPDVQTTVITADTIFNAVYVKDAEGDIYYMMVLSGSPIDTSAMSAMTVEQALDGEVGEFVIPASAEYAEMWQQYDDGEISSEEWETWKAQFIEENKYLERALVPITYDAQFEVEPIGTIIPAEPKGTTTIDGITYDIYEIYDDEFYPVEVDTLYKLKITVITK